MVKSVNIAFLAERMLLGYGVELVMDQLARGLQDRGHKVRVYCCMDDGSHGEAPYEIVKLELARWRSASQYELSAFKAIRRFLDREDLLVVEAFPFFFTGYSSEKPWVAVDHGVVPPIWFPWPKSNWFEYIAETQYGKYLSKAAKIVAVSHFLRSQLPRDLQAKASVIYSGVDHYGKDFIVNLDELLGKDGVRLLYAGRSSDTGPYKDTRKLLDSWKRVKARFPGTKLVMVTSCSMNEEETLRSQGAIVFRNLAQEFMASIFSASDVYATATKWEGFDLPIMEAAYFGKPAVAYNIGAHPEVIVNGETGFIADNDDQFELHLMKLVEKLSLRRDLGSKAEARATNEFKWSSCIDAYESLFLELWNSS